MVASHVPPTGDLAYNPGVCPDWESNQRPFGLQAGQGYLFIFKLILETEKDREKHQFVVPLIYAFIVHWSSKEADKV